MFTDSWIYRGFMRLDLWTKQHGGQGIDRRKMHSFEFGHLRGDYLGLNIVLRNFVMQRWISMKDHTTLCLHAEFGAIHAKPPLSLISRWNKEHYVDFWQPPDISRSHLYRGTFPWTPTTGIYRAFFVPLTKCQRSRNGCQNPGVYSTNPLLVHDLCHCLTDSIRHQN